MSISITVSHGQFFDLYKDSQFLKGMSIEAIFAVLEYIEELQEDDTDIIDWTAVFMSCGEYSQDELDAAGFEDISQHYVIEIESQGAVKYIVFN